MSKTYPNDSIHHVTDQGLESIGLTKREYFAAMAMQGLASNKTPKDAAMLAVQYADALIAALNEEGE